MTYHHVIVNLIVDAETLEEAQIKATLFMPWTTTGNDWSLAGHAHLPHGWEIDQWNIEGVDSEDMESILRERGMR